MLPTSPPFSSGPPSRLPRFPTTTALPSLSLSLSLPPSLTHSLPLPLSLSLPTDFPPIQSSPPYKKVRISASVSTPTPPSSLRNASTTQIPCSFFLQIFLFPSYIFRQNVIFLEVFLHGRASLLSRIAAGNYILHWSIFISARLASHGQHWLFSDVLILEVSSSESIVRLLSLRALPLRV